MLSVALAETVIVPETVDPDVGDVMETVGGVESPPIVHTAPSALLFAGISFT
jgi:hypothetical protein